MATGKKSSVYVYMKRRIAKSQNRAKSVGFLYLLATLVITAAACFPLLSFSSSSAKLGVMEFWKIFKGFSVAKLKTDVPSFLVAGLYGLLLFGLLINVLRAFKKLGWLCKKKASRLYGFNRNAYAMDDMGKIFSGSFSSVVCFHFVMALIAGAGNTKIEVLGFVALGVGLFFHFLCGLLGGGVSLFEVNDGIQEEGRQVGYFMPLIRNLLQLACAGGAVYFFLKCSVLGEFAGNAVWQDGMAGFKRVMDAVTQTPMDFVLLGLHALALVWILSMITYATGTTEFDMEGAETSGRLSYLFLSLLLAVTAGFIYFYFGEKGTLETLDHTNMLIVFGIALVTLVLELCLIATPKVPVENTDDVDAKKYLNANCKKSGVYPVLVKPTKTQPPVDNTKQKSMKNVGFNHYGFDFEE
jgi:hypothetical protein